VGTQKYSRGTLNCVDFSDQKSIDLIPLGDIHLGAPTTDLDLLQRELDWAKKTGAKILGMGDMIEVATKDSVGAGWVEQKMSPDKQIDTITEMFEPLKGQIIGWHSGNHEGRAWKTTGIDVAKQIARNLGVPYYGHSKFTKIKVGEFNYYVYSTHGSSGAKMPHTKIKSCIDLAQHQSADLYLMGHVHQLDTNSFDIRYPDSKNKKVAKKKRYFVLTGHFLDYEGSYAEQHNMYPSKLGVAKIKLNGEKWDIHVSI